MPGKEPRCSLRQTLKRACLGVTWHAAPRTGRYRMNRLRSPLWASGATRSLT